MLASLLIMSVLAHFQYHDLLVSVIKRTRSDFEVFLCSKKCLFYFCFCFFCPVEVSQVLTSFGPFGFFLAGGLCSSLSHVLATPVDVVKTSQQKATRSSETGRRVGVSHILFDKGGPSLIKTEAGLLPSKTS